MWKLQLPLSSLSVSVSKLRRFATIGVVSQFTRRYHVRMSKPGPSDAVEIAFYDGDCGFCHRSVQFIVRRDRDGVFRFAPIGGETFRARLTESQRATLPDSMIVLTREGELLVRSAAALHIFRRLGGLWSVLAALGSVVPRFIADRVYDGVAAVRRKLLPSPTGACPLVPAPLRERFLS